MIFSTIGFPFDRIFLVASKIKYVFVVSIILILSIYSFHFSTQNAFGLEVSLSSVNVQKTVSTADYQGKDLGDKINKANADCGNIGCEIIANESGSIDTLVILSDNRIITFTAGQYGVGASIIVGNNNEIRGQGQDVTTFVREQSWYEGKGSDRRTDPPGDFNQIADAFMFKITNKNNVVLRDFAIDGSTSKIGAYPIEGTVPKPTGKIFPMPLGNQGEVQLTGSSDVKIQSLKIFEVERMAISIRGATNTLIEGCDISSNGLNKDVLIWSGIAETTNLNVINNNIHDGSHAGLFLSKINGALVEGNTFDHNRVNTYFTGSGGQINILYDSHDIAIKNNIISDAGYIPASELPKLTSPLVGHGIEVHGYNVQILNNVIENNGGSGIVLKNNEKSGQSSSHDIIIDGNTIDNNGLESGRGDQIVQEDGVYNITIRNNMPQPTTDSGGTTNTTTADTVPNSTQTRVAVAGDDQTVHEGDTVTLDGAGSNAESYLWKQISGTNITLSDARSASPSFTAPAVGPEGEILTFSLAVKDGTSYDTISIIVQNNNQSPSADAGADRTVDEDITVNLDGTASSDPDGTIASYSWSQTVGDSVSLTGAGAATASFTAPTVSSDATLTFELTVTDSDGIIDTDSVDIIVKNVNHRPEADAGSDQTVHEGDTVTLDGAGSTDSDGTMGSYIWEQIGGPLVTLNNNDAETATFDTPHVNSDTTLTFALTVTDSDGETDTDSIDITEQDSGPHTTSIVIDTISKVPWGKDVKVTGKLYDEALDSGIGGQTIAFDGTGADGLPDVVTNSDGSFSSTGPAQNTVATGWKVEAHYDGGSDSVNEYIASDSPVKSYSTIKHKTSLSLSLSPNPVAAEATYHLAGTLKDYTTGSVLSSKKIKLTADSPITIPDKTTNELGRYKAAKLQSPSTAGSYNLQAHYAGDSLYESRDSQMRILAVQ